MRFSRIFFGFIAGNGHGVFWSIFMLLLNPICNCLLYGSIFRQDILGIFESVPIINLGFSRDK